MHTTTFESILPLVDTRTTTTELDDIESLMLSHRARLLRFVMFSVNDMDVAETIVQDTFIKAYNGRDRFRGESNVYTWLTSIALNLVRDHHRTKKLRFWKQAGKTAVDAMEMADQLPMAGSSPEDQLIAREKATQVSELLTKMSPNQRTVFVMRFQEEMSISEIAEAMNMPMNTVKTHLHRSLKAMREGLGGSK